MQKVTKDLDSGRASKWVAMADFASLESLKTISHKIWVIEKWWNFHTVHSDPFGHNWSYVDSFDYTLIQVGLFDYFAGSQFWFNGSF